MSKKSIVDAMGVKNKAFTGHPDYVGPPVSQDCQGEDPGPDLEVVSHCPSCGGPIYGRKTMRSTDPYAPDVRYSCSCRENQQRGLPVRTT